jgi:hypothetical protein
MANQTLERERVPDFDQFDDVALRAFIAEIPEGETRSLTINHVRLEATSKSFAQDLINQYRTHKSQKQSS